MIIIYTHTIIISMGYFVLTMKFYKIIMPNTYGAIVTGVEVM